MISPPEHQQIDRRAPESAIPISAACFIDAGACGGLGYGIYLGMKVTALPAACKTFCNTAASPICWNNCCCCDVVCRSLMCSGISLGMFVAGGITAGGVLGCCLLAKHACSKSGDDRSDNCESHPIEAEDDTAPAGTMTLMESAPDSGAHSNECVVVMSQPTTRHAEMNDGSDSFRSGVRPEPERNPNTFLPENAPPPYEDCVRPPPSYESIQHSQPVFSATMLTNTDDNVQMTTFRDRVDG